MKKYDVRDFFTKAYVARGVSKKEAIQMVMNYQGTNKQLEREEI